MDNPFNGAKTYLVIPLFYTTFITFTFDSKSPLNNFLSIFKLEPLNTFLNIISIENEVFRGKMMSKKEKQEKLKHTKTENKSCDCGCRGLNRNIRNE